MFVLDRRITSGRGKKLEVGLQRTSATGHRHPRE
jgi:hypothetical protein